MGKLAVITGASAGIGRATALELAAAGLRVIAVGRRGAQLAELSRLSTSIEPIVADVTTQEGRGRICAAVGQRPLYTLLHAAGVFPRGRITALSPQEWRAAIATNVEARLWLVLRLRERLRGGRVLFIGSDAATTPRPGGAAYSVTQAATAMLCRCMAADLGEEMAIAIAKPGLVATGMLTASLGIALDEFPARRIYEEMQRRGETIAAETVARFFRFLLLDVETGELCKSEWDIRDTSHHTRWLQGNLYRGAPEEMDDDE